MTRSAGPARTLVKPRTRASAVGSPRAAGPDAPSHKGQGSPADDSDRRLG